MKTRRHSYTARKMTRKQKGGDEFLKKAQHIHLKLTMRRLGPFFYDVNTIWAIHNQTAKKPIKMISTPDEILDYVRQKTLSPDNKTWSLVDNHLIRYQMSDSTPQWLQLKESDQSS